MIFFLQAVGQLMVKGEKKINFGFGSADAFLCRLPLPTRPDIVCECVGCPLIFCPPCPDCPIVDCPPIACPDCPLPLPCPICEPCPKITCPPPPLCPLFHGCPDCPIPEPCPPEPIKCPIGWTEINGACYSFNGKKASWKAAKQECEKVEGATLANNLSPLEIKYVGDLIEMGIGSTKGTKSYAWIGLSDLEKEGEFKWINGDKYDGEIVINQAKKKSKNDCVSFKRGAMSHAKCGAKKAFVCKMPLDDIIVPFK